MSRLIVFIGALRCCLLLMGDLAHAENVPVDYEKQVKPIFVKHCVGCHNGAKQESGFRLDVAQFAVEGGDRGIAVVPGKSNESLLLKALSGEDDILQMPFEMDPLSDAQIALIREWIDQGAEYPDSESIATAEQVQSDHWAFQPITIPAFPSVKDLAWVRNGIDAFVLGRLDREGLVPSAEADRNTLIRRLYLDLLGITPDVEQVDGFVNDSSTHAYEKLVDRILSSPRYGERWGRHWLDLARYADSNGFTIDSSRSIWKYRDWVVEAFNKDLGFDQFTIDQMAGDMVEDSSLAQLTATGFHRNTLINEEGGTDDEQFRVEAVVDRVNTVGSVYLGLTISCAQCHSHKFDPISQRDFYRLYAIFNNCEDNNDANNSGPIVSIPSPRQIIRKAELTAAIAAAEKPLAEQDAKYISGMPAWEESIAATKDAEFDQLDPLYWTTIKGVVLNKTEDQTLLIDFSVPANDTYVVTLETGLPKITAIRLETLSHDSLPSNGPGRAKNGNFVLSEFEVYAESAASGNERHVADDKRVKLSNAVSDISQEGYSVSDSIDGRKGSGWAIHVKTGSSNVDRAATYFLDEPIENDGGSRITIKMHHNHSIANYLIGCFRIAVTDEETDNLLVPAAIRRIAQTPADKRDDQQKTEILAAYRNTDSERIPLANRVAELKKQLERLNSAIPKTMVLKERDKPRETYVQVRGDFLRPGARVIPGVPSVLPQIDTGSKSPNRLDFSKWLVSQENPLTARVTVNRFWQRFFGIGIVETENDFGVQGILPEHPELLDWLASEFMQHDWSMKKLHRLIVTSATYRQSSHITPKLFERDPHNKLLGRQTRMRLEAETIRDVSLSASGLLSSRMGGPSVYPPQPEGIYILTQQKKAWPESKGGERFRRGLYTYFWRSSPYPLMPTFDAPDATTTCTRRSRSNTPLQALMLANDRAFFEIAQGMATKIMHQDIARDRERLGYAFRKTLSRFPSDVELERLSEFLGAQKKRFEEFEQEAELAAPRSYPERFSKSEAATWTVVSRVLFNLDEFITRE